MITVMPYHDLTGETWISDLPKDMKNKLDYDLVGLKTKTSFPHSLNLMNEPYPIPALGFTTNSSDITDLLRDLDICVTYLNIHS